MRCGPYTNISDVIGSTTRGKGLGKTGDELMGFALKMIPVLMVSAGAIGIGAGALALSKRKAGRR